VTDVLAELRPSNYAVALQLTELPDLIRGYEQVKHAGAEAARARAAELLEQLHRPRLPLMTTGAPLAGLSPDTPWPEVIDVHQEIHRTIVS
jgi:indolepyruvate ferredoxin oxidoreductase